jgi:hypothetical protein
MFSSRVRSEVCKEVDVLNGDFDVEPLPENSFGEYGDFQLVGHGKVTNDYACMHAFVGLLWFVMIIMGIRAKLLLCLGSVGVLVNV